MRSSGAATAAFDGRTSAGRIHQNTTHLLGCDPKKMSAVLPLHVALIHQAKVDFIYERCGLKGVVAALAVLIAPLLAVYRNARAFGAADVRHAE